MKQLATCIMAATFASGLTLWLNSPTSGNIAHARAFQQRQRTLNVPAVQAPTALPDVYDENGLTPDEAVSVHIYEKNNRSVANIMTRTPRRGFLLDGNDKEGSGSGCVLDKDGHILTNYHVIEGAREIRVTLYDGETYEARRVGADPINDTAVIRIDAPREVLFPPPLGDSRKLRVGMKVFAIGNPFGYERTLSTGVISSLNRSLQVTQARSIKSIIQIDAAINPGNSGGPLFDSHGRLIGMNTAIATRTGQSAGIGFAIPISLVQRIVPQLIEKGRVVRADIGITRVYETNKGLLIKTLDPRGPAARAGLKGPKLVEYRRGPFVIESLDRTAADLIVGVDGNETTTTEDFLSYIDSKNPGDEVLIRIVREGRALTVPVVLGE
ncbi:MAG: S1C family serine protease [Planctomycetaceae bacterium]